jgi:hypothetical protein
MEGGERSLEPVRWTGVHCHMHYVHIKWSGTAGRAQLPGFCYARHFLYIYYTQVTVV